MTTAILPTLASVIRVKTIYHVWWLYVTSQVLNIIHSVTSFHNATRSWCNINYDDGTWRQPSQRWRRCNPSAVPPYQCSGRLSAASFSATSPASSCSGCFATSDTAPTNKTPSSISSKQECLGINADQMPFLLANQQKILKWTQITDGTRKTHPLDHILSRTTKGLCTFHRRYSKATMATWTWKLYVRNWSVKTRPPHRWTADLEQFWWNALSGVSYSSQGCWWQLSPGSLARLVHLTGYHLHQ